MDVEEEGDGGRWGWGGDVGLEMKGRKGEGLMGDGCGGRWR